MGVKAPVVDKDHFTPRPYQLELIEKAKRENIIVPLGTGTGKTFIAVALIRELAAPLRLPLEQGGKRSFFLVDKVALVEQQAAQLRVHTDLQVGEYHGRRRNIDLWDEQRWLDELRQHQGLGVPPGHGHDCRDIQAAARSCILVFAAVPSDNPSQVAVLVFDECHHALGARHPFRQIMQQRQLADGQGGSVRVLGLTASIISRNVKPAQLEWVLCELESALQCRVETASDMVALAKYGAKPRTIVVSADDFDVTRMEHTVATVASMLTTATEFCKQCNYNAELSVDPTKPVVQLLSRTLAVLTQLGPWPAWRVCDVHLKQIGQMRPLALTDDQVLFLTLANTYLTAAKTALGTVAQPATKNLDKLMAIFHPCTTCTDCRCKFRNLRSYKKLQVPDKVRRLVRILSLYDPAEGGKVSRGQARFSCLVFVEQRYVALALRDLLRQLASLHPKLKFLKDKIDFMIGYNSQRGNLLLALDEQQQALHRRQEDVLRKFRKGQLQLLVATAVLEEGVDVKQCGLVVRFDPPNDYRAYVQSKGRARRDNARFCVLVERSQLAHIKETFRDFLVIEKILVRRCYASQQQGGALGAALDVEESEADGLDPDALVPAFEPPLPGEPSKRPRVLMSTAIALVNRYCAKLPSDIFTRLVPHCDVQQVLAGGCDNSGSYVATILLPINSPLKQEVKSLPMPSKRLAKMHASLETCKRLYELRELNDHLLPVGKESLAALLRKLGDDAAVEAHVPERGLPGSAKRKQYYDKKVATALIDAYPVGGTECFVHLLQFELVTPATAEANPKNRRWQNPRMCDSQLALLSRNRLPALPSFPLFSRQGEMCVSVQTLPTPFVLDDKQIQDLGLFHQYVFAEVLQLEKKDMEFSPYAKDLCSVLLAPLSRTGVEGDYSYALDKQLIDRVLRSTETDLKQRPPEEVRTEYKFDKDRFQDAVVIPWYREKDHVIYYVADILEETSPRSPFPDEEYKDFNEYFSKKYDLTIYDQTQPLLDVDYVTQRLNMLTSRTQTRRGMPIRSVLKKQGGLSGIQKQMLVPELMCVHPVPASVWHMMVMVPSALYRVNSLLLADQLRLLVQTEALGASLQLATAESWPQLSYGWKYKTGPDLLHAIQEHDRRAEVSRRAREQEDRRKTDRYLYGPGGAPDPGTAAPADAANADTDAFTIDMWDPNVAVNAGLAARSSYPSTVRVDEPVLLGASAAAYNDEMQLNGTDEPDEQLLDDLDNIVFDVEFSNHMQRYRQQGTAGNGISQDALSSHFAEPRSDIVPRGWGDADAEPPAMDIGGLQILSTGASRQLDTKGLEMDIAAWTQPPAETRPAGAQPTAATGVAGATRSAAQAQKDADEKKQRPAGSRTGQPQPQKSAAALCDDLDYREPDEDLFSLLPPELQLKFGLCDDAPLQGGQVGGQAEGGEGSQADIDDTLIQQDVLVDNLDELAPPSVISEASGTGERHRRHGRSAAEKKVHGESTCAASGASGSDAVAARQSDAPSQEKTAQSTAASSDDDQWLSACPQGPSPALILQALTTSNASDAINLERLETVGDSFLKYSTTVYLYHQFGDMHEGKLSFMRSKQVSNYKLYRLGVSRDSTGGQLQRDRSLPLFMMAAKFEPNDNWLPPCYKCNERSAAQFKQRMAMASGTDDTDDTLAAVHEDEQMDMELSQLDREQAAGDAPPTATTAAASASGSGGDASTSGKALRRRTGWDAASADDQLVVKVDHEQGIESLNIEKLEAAEKASESTADVYSYHGYNLLNQHSVSDKSVADCVEALIGVYLLSYGPPGALRFMDWLGLHVRPPDGGTNFVPPEPLLHYVPDAEQRLEHMWNQYGLDGLEAKLGYRFQKRAFLLQAVTHASYVPNRVTDCYQRLEFLGDAVLDYVITRHLYDDSKQYSPGVLTDLRSALVNNTIFASLAVKHNFHKHFLQFCPGLAAMVAKYVRLVDQHQLEAANFDEDLYLINEDDCDESDQEDIEVPKALGDIFESLAGAVFLDSGCSLDRTWAVFYELMKSVIDKCCASPPQSPIRELLEMEPDKVKFTKAERLIESGKVRVWVEVRHRCRMAGLGRNYRIAKCTAAKRALRYLKQLNRQHHMQQQMGQAAVG